MLLSNFSRGYYFSLLASGYSLEAIANATLQAEETKEMRAESLRSAGWSNPWDLLTGAVETTGIALRRADILGVGAAVGAGVQGVNAVVGAGADVTVKTGRFIVDGATRSTRAVVDGATRSTRAVTDAGNKLVVKPVGKVVTSTSKAVTSGVSQTGRAIGTGITTTGRAVGGAVGSVMNTTGRAISYVVNPGATNQAQQKQARESGKRSPKSELSPKRSMADLTAINAQ
jgi:hypothetical protein